MRKIYLLITILFPITNGFSQSLSTSVIKSKRGSRYFSELQIDGFFYQSYSLKVYDQNSKLACKFTDIEVDFPNHPDYKSEKTVTRNKFKKANSRISKEIELYCTGLDQYIKLTIYRHDIEVAQGIIRDCFTTRPAPKGMLKYAGTVYSANLKIHPYNNECSKENNWEDKIGHNLYEVKKVYTNSLIKN